MARFLPQAGVNRPVDLWGLIAKPFLMLALGALGAAIWWWVGSDPRDAAKLAQNAVSAIRYAPRKPAFRRQMNAYPVEGIDLPRIAICAIALAFAFHKSPVESPQR